jgi:hypothetical protein
MENKVRFGLQDHWTQRKRFRIRLQQVLQKARTKIPPLVAEFTVFRGRPLYGRPRGELDSLSCSIFSFVC